MSSWCARTSESEGPCAFVLALVCVCVGGWYVCICGCVRVCGHRLLCRIVGLCCPVQLCSLKPSADQAYLQLCIRREEPIPPVSIDSVADANIFLLVPLHCRFSLHTAGLPGRSPELGIIRSFVHMKLWMSSFVRVRDSPETM